LGKIIGNLNKFWGEVLDEIGGIYYKFGKNSEQIGEEFRALLWGISQVFGNYSCITPKCSRFGLGEVFQK
jgi:hypothetical protein